MRARSYPWVAATLLLAAPVGAQEKASLVFTNGRVFSAAADSQTISATTVAIRGDRIVYVGDAAGAAKLRDQKTRWVDVGGGAILPGLVDAHAHLGNLGKLLRTVSLVGTKSAGEALARVVSAQKRVGTERWIYGRGWDQNDWPDTAFPTWRDLSGTERNPVYLERVDGHALWVNRTALEACGITRDTPDPPGGRILHDARGEPTGILVDDAEELVVARVPTPGADEVEARVELAIRECNRFGLVGVHDAGTDRAVLGALHRLASRGELTLNVYCMLDSDEPPLLQEHFATGPKSEFGGRIVMRAIKLRADGALGSRGAALLEPYSDDPGNRGTNVDSPDSILYWTREAVRHGFQVATHAIGDRANGLTLDIYEQVLRETQARDARLRVEHCQILAFDDVERFAKLGVVASMQPTHCTSDMPWAERRVGRERLGGAYVWQFILQTGAALAFGSDFPVESVNPLLGLYAAVTRQDADGNPPGGWNPAQRLTLAQALRAFTEGAAYASFDGGDAGTIAVGKRADLTILDRDVIGSVPDDPRELLRAHAAFTVVRGEIVYEARD
jgi:predicted amidohydrolase YtcJ